MDDIPCCEVHEYMMTHQPKAPVIIFITLQRLIDILTTPPKQQPDKEPAHANQPQATS